MQGHADCIAVLACSQADTTCSITRHELPLVPRSSRHYLYAWFCIRQLHFQSQTKYAHMALVKPEGLW